MLLRRLLLQGVGQAGDMQRQAHCSFRSRCSRRSERKMQLSRRRRAARTPRRSTAAHGEGSKGEACGRLTSLHAAYVRDATRAARSQPQVLRWPQLGFAEALVLADGLSIEPCIADAAF